MGFKKAENKMAYLKMAIMGFQSSGKSYTSFVVAKGLHQHLGLEKPICVVDTENARGFLLDEFADEKTKFVEPTDSSLGFKNLLTIVREAEKECSILIIDSISAFSEQLLDDIVSGRKYKQRSLLVYGEASSVWRQFIGLFLNSKIHIIFCGRAAFEYTAQEKDNGKMEIMATGTKMKVTGQTEYEPSLLIEMERRRGKEVGDKLEHYAHVVKDRAGKKGIDGMFKPDPTFDFFLPHIEALNIGGEHEAYDMTRNSQEMFEDGGEGWNERKRQREIACEELKNILTLWFNGTTVDKKAKIEKLQELFGVTSFVEIENVNSKKVTLNKILDVTQILKERKQDNGNDDK